MIKSVISKNPTNVLGSALRPCCADLSTGWFRNGSCETDDSDRGKHVVCAQMTNEFLSFSQAMGNDLSTSVPEFNFPGLKEGDFWCLCAGRWQEAFEAGVPPKVKLLACEESALQVIDLENLKAHAL